LTHGIADAEFFLDQLFHAAARPDRIGVTELGRPFFEKAFELDKLFVVEFRRSTGVWLGREGFDALFVENFSPTFDA